MTYSMRTNFQRSQSKVWFGNNASPSSYYSAFHSLPAIIDSQSDKFSIQEQNELKNSPEEILNVSSKLNISVWSNHGSPSSHKSQVLCCITTQKHYSKDIISFVVGFRIF